MTKDKIDLKLNGEKTALKVQYLLANLIKCMSQETLAIKASNQEVAMKMSQEKMRLLVTYEAIAMELDNNPDLLKSLDDGAADQLKDLISEFDVILKDNMTAIQAGKNAISRVIHRLLKKARASVAAKTRRYNDKGEMIEKQTSGGVISGQLNEQY